MKPLHKRSVIIDALHSHPDWSNRRVAVATGVDDKTVGAIRGQMIYAHQLANYKKLVGRDGKCRPARSRSVMPLTSYRRLSMAVPGAVPQQDRLLWLLGIDQPAQISAVGE